MRLDICVGGSGGQGVLLFGTTIIHAAVQEGKRAICLPNYGAEARGGEVSCFVIFSDSEIRSPFADAMDYLVFFNSASFTKFREHIRSGVTIFHDAAAEQTAQVPPGVRSIGVPLGDLVAALDRRCANMAMLGAFVECTRILDCSTLESTFDGVFKGKGGSFIGLNQRAVEAGRQWAKGQGLSPGGATAGPN
jgi:Pyruvate/2-oxoacid:ferredoxin oxidoreductase gamma subunit